jgi:hypothetical protein
MIIIYFAGPAAREIIWRGLQPFAVKISFPFPFTR